MNATTISPKVGMAAVAGAVVAIGVWVLGQNHITVPGDIAAAATTIVMFVTGYLFPHAAQ